jgi:hypothetical protein
MARTLLLLLALASGFASAQSSRPTIRFEVAVLPEVERYLGMLAVPGFAALALENNGLYTSLSSRMVIKSREQFEVRGATVRYVGQKGRVYSYEAGTTLFLGIGESTFTFPAEIDTSEVRKGKLVIRVHTPLAGVLPQEIVDRIQFKIRSIADLHSQRKLLDYLDRLTLEQAGGGTERVLEAIAFEAYNRSARATGAGGERRDASVVSDIAILLIVASIWLIGFPIFLLLYRRRQRQVPPPQA